MSDPAMSLSQRMRRVEPFLSDLYLGACCLWAAKCFTAVPSPLATYPAAYHWLQHIEGRETSWGLLSLLAGLLLTFGLACTVRPVTWALSLVLRSVGLMLSAFLWGAIGVSFMVASPNVITAGPMLMMSLASLWTLLRTPALPRGAP